MQEQDNNGGPTGITIDWSPPNGKGRLGYIVARNGDDDCYTDRLDITKAASRSTLVDKLVERWPTLQDHRHALEADLERKAANEAARPATASESPDTQGQPDPAALLAAMHEAVRTEARAMLGNPDLLKKIGADFATIGIAGERSLAGCIYLTGTSRLLPKPLALLIQGPSSSGKSHVLKQVARLFPPEAVLSSTTMSAAALYYAPAGSLHHKFVVAGERSRKQDDDQTEVTRALRELLSEGQLSRLVTIKKPSGPPVAELVQQEGPIAYCETTTLPANRVFTEDLNRMLLLSTNETPEQTRAVLQTVANRYEAGLAEAAAAEVAERHHAIQRMLQPLRVVVPFAVRLVELLPPTRLEVRRGAEYLLAMTAASALLHQYQRALTADGEVVANLDDYRLAQALLSEPLGRLLGRRLSDGSLRFLGRLWEWFGSGEYTLPEARSREEHSVSGVYSWNSELLDQGFVELVEKRRGNTAARFQVVKTPEVAAEAVALLPDAEQLKDDP